MIHAKEEPLLAQEYKVYRYRYFVAILYFSMGLLGSFMNSQFLAIQTTLENIYSSSTYIINFTTTTANYIANIPIIFLSNFLVDKYGLKVTVYIGSVLYLVALWVRTLENSSLAVILIGQVLGSISFSFFSAPQKVSVNWFSSAERALWTTIMVQGMSTGIGISTAISGNLVPPNVEPAQGRTDINNFMFYTAIVGTVMVIIVCIFFREKPPKPPSPAAVHEKKSFWFSLKVLFSTKQNLLAISGASTFFGGIIAYLSTLDIIITPMGVTSSELGTFFFAAIIPGWLGALSISKLASKKTQMKKVVLITGTLTSLCLFSLYVSTVIAYFPLMVTCASIYGFFIQPMLPMLLELLCEISYPAGEAVSAGMIYIIGNILGVGVSFIIDTIMDAKGEGGSLYSFFILCGMMFCGNLMVFASKSRMERTLQEQKVSFDVGSSNEH